MRHGALLAAIATVVVLCVSLGVGVAASEIETLRVFAVVVAVVAIGTAVARALFGGTH